LVGLPRAKTGEPKAGGAGGDAIAGARRGQAPRQRGAGGGGAGQQPAPWAGPRTGQRDGRYDCTGTRSANDRTTETASERIQRLTQMTCRHVALGRAARVEWASGDRIRYPS
jgi:hypothetical protein